MTGEGAEGLVIRSCLSVGADKTAAARLGQLSIQDWQRVIAQARRHGVAPLLYEWVMREGGGVVIPSVVARQLREASLTSALTSLRLRKALAEVLTALRKDGAETIVLKGAHLAELVYGNWALRPMEDVDLLVDKAALERVEARLIDMGYGRLERPDLRVDYAKRHHLRPFVDPTGVKIEIHWTIERPAAPFEIDLEGLWARARPATIAGVDALVLSPEDLLLHVCLHASFSHQFSFGFKAFYDIVETIRRYRDEIQWKELERRALRWRIGRHAYLTLRLARELLGAAVPDEVLVALEPDVFDPQVVTWAKTQILFDGSGEELSDRLIRLWRAKELRERIAVFVESAMLSPSAMAGIYGVPSGSPWIYLYYPIRWKKLVSQYGASTWRLLRRDKTMTALAERRNQEIALRDWLTSAR